MKIIRITLLYLLNIVFVIVLYFAMLFNAIIEILYKITIGFIFSKELKHLLDENKKAVQYVKNKR